MLFIRIKDIIVSTKTLLFNADVLFLFFMKLGGFFFGVLVHLLYLILQILYTFFEIFNITLYNQICTFLEFNDLSSAMLY